jgi:dihydrofolate reductase
MGNVIASLFMTLDGVMEAPVHKEAFTRSGWSVPYWNEQIANLKRDELLNADALLLGRITYMGFAQVWPTLSSDELSGRMNAMPKWIASKTLQHVDWNGAQLIRGELVPEVRRLKQLLRNDLVIYGSRRMIYSLMPHDVIDEYRLLVYPVLLGAGKKLFEDIRGVHMRLGESHQLGEVTLMRLFRKA